MTFEPSGAARPRVIVTTDPELDDLNSMLRLLLYSNEIDIAGLVYSASQFHYRGDRALGIEPHRWPSDDTAWHIDRAVDAYQRAYPNLRCHDARYPSPAHLRSLIRHGNTTEVGDMREPTPGSDLIAEILLDDDQRPVFVQAWGGLNTIARALKSVEDAHVNSNDWDEIASRVSSKTVITSFGKQDATFDEYIDPFWPTIEHRQVATSIWGYFAWKVVVPEHAHLLSAEWTRAHVSDVGPIGAEYRVWGDGEQMAAEFDSQDYFGLAGHTVDELEAMGYTVWSPLRPPGSWISEGDSSNFALLIDNGLRSWEHPNHGGWGGRQQRAGSTHRWDSALARDRAPDGSTPDDYHAARWFEAIQNDFAARLRWTITDDPQSANHHPSLSVDPGHDVTTPPGASVSLRANVSDPDGDDVHVDWWVYREAGTCPLQVEIRRIGPMDVVAEIPANAESGHTIHLIAEATDSGDPPLKRYQRVIVTVA